jgi:FkbM family methyltransferase
MARPAPLNIPAAIGKLQEDVQRLDGEVGRLHAQMAGLLRKHCVQAAAAKLAGAGRSPRLPLEFKAQHGEDLVLYEIFDAALDGFFIEVGAFDGVSYSVTYILEALGWTGLLIEALPERCEQCRVSRPRSRVVHAALGPRGASGTTTFHIADDSFGGMMSYHKPTPMQVAHLDAAGVKRRPVTVPLTSMDELLREHTGGIDAAVIDVEGGEAEVLAGFDLLKHRPRVLMIEDNTLGKDPVLTRHMSTQPYVLAGMMSMNRLYVRADQVDLLSRARRAV